MYGLIRARGLPGRAGPATLEEVEATPATATMRGSAPARDVAGGVPASRAAPADAPAAPPARATPPSAATAPADEKEEEEFAFELPAAGSGATAAEAVSTTDELEDLFGELESEVEAATDEEEVLYECPNCHGQVREEDSSCPHCQVVFES